MAAIQAVPVDTGSFCCWVQLCLSKLVNEPLSQVGRHAHFTAFAGHVHAFLCWPRLVQYWEVLLKAAGVECNGAQSLLPLQSEAPAGRHHTSMSFSCQL